MSSGRPASGSSRCGTRYLGREDSPKGSTRVRRPLSISALRNLIKRSLGPKRSRGVEGSKLLYFWYEWPSPIASAHRAEIERFAATTLADIDFRVLTYQHLFEQLETVAEPTPGYLSSLRSRYF